MTDNINPEIMNIKNTFVPSIDNEWLSISDIISCLQRGFCEFSDLPEDVKEKVNVVVDERLQESNTKPTNSYKMSQLVDDEIQNIKNTFIPSVDNEWLSIDGIITLLQRGFVKFSSLPEDVKEKVHVVLEQRLQESNTKSKNPFSKDTSEESK